MRPLNDGPGPIAVTMGEPAGIGIEIALKAWLKRAEFSLPPFLCVGCAKTYRKVALDLDLPVEIEAVASPEMASNVFVGSLPIIDLPLSEDVRFGAIQSAHAETVVSCIRRAVDLTRQNETAAVVTNPIQKQALWAAGFRYPGHTEFIGALCAQDGGDPSPVMMLMIDGLKVVPVTVHMALAEVSAHLNSELIVQKCRIVARALRHDFGLDSPRLAFAALNPHAGEQGKMGTEEATVLTPAIERLRSDGLIVTGPHPADTMFHAGARERYDVAICMYHDQALIPLKTLDFDKGVNVTLGLPIVRTSPDHGTALDIAGQGVANPASLIASLKVAKEISDGRVSRE